MFALDLACPGVVWPASLSADIALGIKAVSGPDTDTLWLMFQIRNGALKQSSGVLTADNGMPNDIAAAKPAIVAVAPRTVWQLVGTDRDEFFKQVEANQVHLSGDYRVFGRYSPSLLKIVEATQLWAQIDEVIGSVAAQQAEP